MLSWLKKVAGGSSPSPESLGDLSEEQCGWLSKELEPLGEIRTGLSRDAVRFVATGAGEPVLEEIAQHRGRASDLLSTGESREAGDRLLESLRPGQAGAAVRLARLYEAASRQVTQGTRALDALPAEVPAWLDIFLLLSVGFSLNRHGRERIGKVDLALIEEMLAAEGHPRDLMVRAFLEIDAKDLAATWTARVLNSVPGWDRALGRHPERVREALARKEAKRRVQALELIADSEADLQPFATEIAELATSPAKSVRELATVLLGKISKPAEPAPAPKAEFDLPPLPPVDVNAPLGQEVRQALEACYRELHAERNPHDPAWLPSPDVVDAAFRMLQMATWADPVPPQLRLLGGDDPIHRFLAHPGLKLIHAMRFLFLYTTLSRKEWHGWWVLQWLGHFYTSHEPRFSLRELAAVFRAVGLAESNVEHMFLARTFWMTISFELEPESVWPFFAERPEALERALAATDEWAEDRRRNALEALGMFPRLPRRLAPRVWDVALNGAKKDRPRAQACLDREPDRDEKLIAFLAGSRAEVRAGAAEWLGRLASQEDIPAAVPALKAALGKEKQEAAAGAMMLALERLGVPPAEIVDFDHLLAEARKGLKKGAPAGLSWLGFETLPTVRWRESGELVESEVIHWLIVQSHKLGSPEPGTRLRYLATYFRPEDAEALGQHVLDAWIAWDSVGHTPDEAHAHAAQMAPQYVQWAQRFPAELKSLTEEEYYRQLYTARLMEPRGSAIKEKGILAVAAAGCGGRAAAAVERYLKRFYGTRAAQCRALLQMLAWADHRSAAQVLLATSARFRTPGIRQEAERLVQALAERKGWTVDQLADRTIPTAGFDESCELVLDYGGRTFTAKLGEDWSVVLTNEEGKEVKALPDPRQDDDEEKAKEAKKALSTARKEIKDVLRLQKDRLYEAMCTQRSWPFEDWDEFLNRHPVVRRYCQRLVWSVWDGETLAATFRSLEDGTLTDAEDEEVRPGPQAMVRLAHSCVMPRETAAAWLRHFADYKVQPLFAQLGGAWMPPEELKRTAELAEFQGWMLEAFALRGRATKLGWTRGPAEDAAIFSTYQKHFPGVGLTALLEFTGNMLPEENRTVALTTLSFHTSAEQTSGYSAPSPPLPLGEVPAVLLSECRNDLAAIAAQGPGFDPEWEKKTAW